MKSKKKILTLFTIIPLVSGIIIYLFFRKSNIILFDWLLFSELKDSFNYLKITSNDIPDWFIYFLPDFLWMFSFTSLMIYIWQKEITYFNLLWIFIPLLFAILFELFQKFKIFKGTYDNLDILSYVTGNILSILLNFKFNKCLIIPKFTQNDKN